MMHTVGVGRVIVSVARSCAMQRSGLCANQRDKQKREILKPARGSFVEKDLESLGLRYFEWVPFEA
jgi:hypothetical protein